jgi:hypothetical protein
MGEAADSERDRMNEAAAQSLGALSQVVANERHALEAHSREVMEALASVAEQARREAEGQSREAMDALARSAEQARRDAEAHAQAVRDKIDQLGEAAFTVGQRADAVFEARLSEARGLVDQSARMVEDAGVRSAEQLTKGVVTARETLTGLETLLSQVEARIAQLPADAEAGAEHVRSSLARGMDELMASARRAADETQSIDAAFQDRVRRNYDMLSEAVRLMGVVAGAASSAPAAAPRPPPRAPLAPAAGQEGQQPPLDEAGLRPRLKLTPTASDEEFKTVFKAAGGREPPETGGEEWTWKELLSSMDEAPPSDEALAGALIGEIEAMGIDAAALLPRPRIDEIAAATQAKDDEGARELVRRLAPAAIRRLVRRMATERRMRAQADRYVRRYEALVAEAIGRGGDRVVISALLGSDQGRAYLLLDAALVETV